MDRRAVFFLGAALVSGLFVPLTDPPLRWVPEVLAITYVVLALASYLDARTNRWRGPNDVHLDGSWRSGRPVPVPPGRDIPRLRSLPALPTLEFRSLNRRMPAGGLRLPRDNIQARRPIAAFLSTDLSTHSAGRAGTGQHAERHDERETAGQPGFRDTPRDGLIRHFWLYHCHVNDHIAAGMSAPYRVF